MSRTRPPQKQKKKVPKTWDEGRACAPCPLPACLPAGRPAPTAPTAALAPAAQPQPQPCKAAGSGFVQLCTGATAASSPPPSPPTAAAEYWENYTGPRIMENRYVWAAATAAATLAAVYSSAVQRGALR